MAITPDMQPKIIRRRTNDICHVTLCKREVLVYVHYAQISMENKNSNLCKNELGYTWFNDSYLLPSEHSTTLFEINKCNFIYSL